MKPPSLPDMTVLSDLYPIWGNLRCSVMSMIQCLTVSPPLEPDAAAIVGCVKILKAFFWFIPQLTFFESIPQDDGAMPHAESPSRSNTLQLPLLRDDIDLRVEERTKRKQPPLGVPCSIKSTCFFHLISHYDDRLREPCYFLCI